MKSLEEIYAEIVEKLAAMDTIPEYLTEEGKAAKRVYCCLRRAAEEVKTVEELRTRIEAQIRHMIHIHLGHHRAGDLVQDDLMDDLEEIDLLLKYVSERLDGR